MRNMLEWDRDRVDIDIPYESSSSITILINEIGQFCIS